MSTKVKFQPANAKLANLAEYLEELWQRKPHIYGFSLPAGHSCPFADACLSKADRYTGKLTDGPNTQFRCFMATMEGFQPSMRQSVWANFDALRECKNDSEAMAELLQEAQPKNSDVVRIDVDGDFFNQAYFDAWLIVCRNNPHVNYYAYTKSLGYWVARLGEIPANLNLNASYGGRLDHLIEQHNLKSAKVVFHPSEADALGLEIDHDETHALFGNSSFALLLHGQQPKGSKASEALKTLKAEDIEYSYTR
jgi:hypothetical protein